LSDSFKISGNGNSCYAESATIEQHIEDRILLVKRKEYHQDAELKGVEEYAIECSILKVAVSEDVQNCADEGIQIFGGMGF
jgi:alkylation response protein AidB-like acyl-CoA dehydrogenase